MVLWIGVDDTDSLEGMCTTWLATELVRVLTRDDDLVGHPRLVRLNPNIPWKTRGNGALCVRIGEGRGTPFVVGRLEGQEILAYPRGEAGSPLDVVARRVATVVERWSRFDDPATEPGFAVLRGPAPSRLYWNGVRTILEREDVLRAAEPLGHVKGYKAGRGVIGAVAATAWRPRDRTYEVLAYRREHRWGTRRVIETQSVIEMDRVYPSTFNNYDTENRRVVIAPRSPCPILFGIRGENPGDLPLAMRLVRGEQPARWLIFETNQGTDDHVVNSSKVVPFHTISFQGTITRSPRTLLGGHVVFAVDGKDVAAYEPSKQFRSVVRALVEGDRVRIVGAVRDSPHTINLEKLEVLALAADLRKVANPLCPKCNRRAKSMGRGHGYRCPACGQKFPPEAARRMSIPRTLIPGWYEPPVGSRRHLSRPLKRMREPGKWHRESSGKARGGLPSSERPGSLSGHLLDSQPRYPEPLLENLDGLREGHRD